ncbi:restriction endonuclease [Algiphilus aromaticivorans]|uniref:restriction endonuclease n=1 Tax=Algiphilus aromaticivorans TaxID=382454 RepID=UPI0005C1A7A0|nr:restriction endonuclease [Algiphilus aromaticivorans]
MARRRKRKSELEDWISVLAKLPWQFCVALIPVAYIGFAALARISVPKADALDGLGVVFASQIAQTAGMFLQYLVPAVLAIAALVSWLAKRRRRKLLSEAESRAGAAGLLDISWKEFEQLVRAGFERDGYAVRPTADGADGGVDLVLSRNGESFLVQCKQWRASKIGVGVVRELFGVMAARGAVGGFVVGVGEFTRAAHEFAEGRNITLLNARDMLERAPEQPRSEPAVSAEGRPQPDCPRCGAAMILRTAKRGANAGRTFYGCSKYPACKQTVEAAQS